MGYVREESRGQARLHAPHSLYPHRHLWWDNKVTTQIPKQKATSFGGWWCEKKLSQIRPCSLSQCLLQANNICDAHGCGDCHYHSSIWNNNPLILNSSTNYPLPLERQTCPEVASWKLSFWHNVTKKISSVLVAQKVAFTTWGKEYDISTGNLDPLNWHSPYNDQSGQGTVMPKLWHLKEPSLLNFSYFPI